MSIQKPVIGITMGDGAGVGPEIIMKALVDPHVYDRCSPFVIGDPKILRRAGRIVGGELTIRSIQDVSEAEFTYSTVDCLDLDLLPADLPFGQVSAEAGNAAFCYLEKAIQLANAEK